MGPKKRVKSTYRQTDTSKLYSLYNERYLEETDPVGYKDWVNIKSTKLAKENGFWVMNVLQGIRKITLAELNRKVIGSKIQFTSDVRCVKCHAYTVTFTMVQTRSADEPQSVVYKCLSCKHQW